MSTFSLKLLDWYATNARVLPWRGHSDPYAVWVSEIMLQQTRVEAVLPYFERWMQRFPTLESLAEASEQEVLSLWEGLGYYSRARNLHRAAGLIISEYQGKVPEDVSQLVKLPGIGRYTAGAIASMAFGKDAPVLDGNIRRILARVFDLDVPADGREGAKLLWRLAEDNLPPGKAGDHNQALMDLGSLICLPGAPKCALCPIQRSCLAYKNGTQNIRPVLKEKQQIPHYTVTAAVIERGGLYLLAQRPKDKLLGGMWEFPGGKVEIGESLERCLQREIREELGVAIRVGEDFGVYKHAYTHFKITLHAFQCSIPRGEPRPIEPDMLAWVPVGELDAYPMGKVDRMIARGLQKVLK